MPELNSIGPVVTQRAEVHIKDETSRRSSGTSFPQHARPHATRARHERNVIRMAIKRMTLAAATALTTAALAVGTAAAAATTEVTLIRGINLDLAGVGASQACGFLIEIHTVGKQVFISHYDSDGTLRSSSVQDHWDGYLLNPANGKTISSKVSGLVRDVYDADGSIVETSAGSTVRTAPGAGLVSGF